MRCGSRRTSPPGWCCCWCWPWSRSRCWSGSPSPRPRASSTLAGLDAEVDGAPRRRRHPAALRRLDRRPDAGAGLRARAGPVLRDGRPAPHHLRPALRAVRRGHRRDRHLRPHPRLARGRREGGGAARAGDPRRVRGVRRRRQRLPRADRPRRARPRVLRARPRRPRLRAGAVDHRRLARLAEGDGVGPARQHGRGDRPGAVAVDELRRRWWPSSSRPTTLRSGGRSSPRAPSSTASSTRARPAAAGCPSGPAYLSTPAALDALRRGPRPGRPGAGVPRQGRRHRLQQLGGLRRPLLDRPAAARQRPAPRRRHARDLDADGPALPDGQRRLPARRLRLHLLRDARGGDRPQRRHRLGLHQPRPRRDRPLPGEGRRRPVAPRRAAAAAVDAPRGDRGRRRRGRRHHRPVDGARPAALRRRPAGRRGRRARAARPRRPRAPRPDGYAVALAWTALEPSATADAIMQLNVAGDWDEFRAAASTFAVPSQNLVYADREGHIGYQAPGRIPIRKSGNDGTGAGRGLALRRRLDGRLRAVRRAAQRARPRGGVRRDRQPAGDRRRLPVLPHRRLGPRLPRPADPRR